MSELLDRIAALAARDRAKSASLRDQMRARYPEASAFIADLRERGMRHAVVHDGVRYGPEPLWFRRTIERQPKVPGRNG